MRLRRIMMKRFLIILLCTFGAIVLLCVTYIGVICLVPVKIPSFLNLHGEGMVEPKQLPEINTILTLNKEQENSISPQVFSTLLGYTSFEHPAPKGMLATETGLYIVDKANHHDVYPTDDKPYLGGMNLSITRWDTEGNFQWEFILDHEIHFQNYCDVFVEDVCVDDAENIYILGSLDVLNRRYFLHHWVPYFRGRFLFCLSKHQEVQWVRFLSDESERQNIIFQKNKLYLISTRDYDGTFWDGPSNYIRCMNPVNGRKLWTRTIDASDFDLLHTDKEGMYLLTYEEKIPILHCYDWKARKQWACEIPIPHPFSSSTLPKHQRNRKIVSCNSNNGHVYLGFSSFIFDEENAKLFDQTYHLYSLNREGKIDWTQTNQSDESTCIIDIQCLENLLCILSQTNADGLATEHAYQKERKGDTDLLLSILDVNGVVQWKTYIGGTELQPYYGFLINYPTQPYRCSIYQDRIAVVCSTSSKDFPVFKAPKPSFQVSSDEAHNGKLPPSYNVVFVFDLEGRLQWSTYTSSYKKISAGSIDSQSDISKVLKKHDNGNQVQAMQIIGDYLYIMETSNDPNTVLNNPKQHVVSFGTHSYQNALEILSKYRLK
jgi:hypothetical protein